MIELFKITAGVVATILVFIAYIPYILDTINGVTQPHPWSWLNSVIITTLVFILQLIEKAGPISWLTAIMALISFIIFLMSIKNKFSKIKKIDMALFAISMVAIILWLVVDGVNLAALLIAFATIAGFTPVLIKTYQDPQSETFATYLMNGIRHLLIFASLETYVFATLFYPVVWVLLNVIMIILMKRKRI